MQSSAGKPIHKMHNLHEKMACLQLQVSQQLTEEELRVHATFDISGISLLALS
jgi:hypothetical protein